MATVKSDRPRRQGRPPDTESSETRAAIIRGARTLFGERGYGAATNADLASAAGVTTGALYHYTDSKLDLYVQVHRQTQLEIYERFQQAEASQTTFVGKLVAALEVAHDMNREDPSLAKFIGAVRLDTRRNPQIRDALGATNIAREQFFVRLVDAGISSGEVRYEDAELVEEFVRLILVGLTDGSSDSLEQHRLAIDSLIAMVNGTLVQPVHHDTTQHETTQH